MKEITYIHETYWQDGLCFVIWRDNLRIARCDSKKTAGSICKCVNCHDELVAACEDFAKGWPHFCNCIDFGKSALDADAIRWMNEAPGKIGAALANAKKAGEK